MVESSANNRENYYRNPSSFSSQKPTFPLENITPYPGVDIVTSKILPAQAILPDFEVLQPRKIGKLKGQKNSGLKIPTSRYIKPQGVQIDLYPHSELLQSEQLISDLEEANNDFENHVSDFFALGSRVKSNKNYATRYGYEKDFDSVPNPYVIEIANKFNELYSKAREVPETKEILEQERIKNQPVRREVKILAEEKIWHQITLDEWESERGVIEYNAKLQGWEILITPSQQ